MRAIFIPLFLVAFAWAAHSMAAAEARADALGAGPRLAAIEIGLQGRLGVAALDLRSGRRIEYRASERFPFCSTMKFLVAARVLAQADAEPGHLELRITYGMTDLVPHSPVASARVGEGAMTIGALAAAAVEESDNAAANLLMETFGGLPAMTRFARSIGDKVSRFDRSEPALNTALRGDERDTTSPDAMISDLKAILVGTVLSAESRHRLDDWLTACTTGRGRLRAGLPAGWSGGDKTGTGENGTSNDIAIFRRPDGSIILIAVFVTGSAQPPNRRDAAFKEIAAMVVRQFTADGGGRRS